jgi:hypothetical protein
MTCAEYGLWTLGRELSYKKNLLFFDGRNMAKRFRRGGKTAMYDHMHKLIKSGWFVVVELSKRKPNGQWSAHVLRVLSHEDWVAAHPEEAKKSCKTEEEPVRFAASACPVSDGVPVPETGHSIGKDLQSDKNLQSGDNLVRSACPQKRTGMRALTDVLHKPQAEALEQPVSAACPVIRTGPVPETGQADHACSIVENPPASPPVLKRRTQAQLTTIARALGKTVDALLAGGGFELVA